MNSKCRKSIFTLSVFIILNYNCSSQGLKADEIYSNFNEALVVIISYGFNGNPLWQGSGVIISDSGYVVTNYHNFKDAENIVVKYKGKLISGNEIIGADIVRDLLVLKLKGNNYKSIKTADLSKIKVGQKIYTIGSPFGLENTISEGIISGIRYEEDLGRNLIQFTAPITHGSSGGALLNDTGEIIGITSSGYDEGNINFAIPINELENINIIPINKRKEIGLLNLYYRGVNAYSAKYYNEAITYFKYFINIDSSKYFIYHKMGLAYEKLEKFDSAEVYLNLSIKKNPNFALSYAELGYIKLLMSKYDEAELKLKKAVEIDSLLVFALNNLGALYIYNAEFDSSIYYCTQALNLNRFYIGAYVNLSVAYKRLKEYDKAISVINEALIYDSNSDINYYNLGSCYLLKGDNYSAIENFINAIKINPNFISAYASLGVTYLIIGDYDKAQLNLNRVLDFYDKNKLPKRNFKNYDLYKTYLGLGKINYIKQDYKTALQYLKEAEKFNENDLSVYIELAKNYKALNDHSNEFLYLIKIVDQDSSYWKFYASIGDYYFKQKKYKNAIENYRNYIRYNYNDLNVMYYLSYSYCYLNKLDSAKYYLNIIIENDSSRANTYNLLGTIFVTEGNFDQGIKMFLKSIELGEDEAGVDYNIGNALLKMDKRDEAINYFRKSAKLGYERAIDWLKNNNFDY